jgi:autotransporter-associated beta strand protein
MKKIILSLLGLISFLNLTYSQETFYWMSGANSGNWSGDNARWFKLSNSDGYFGCFDFGIVRFDNSNQPTMSNNCGDNKSLYRMFFDNGTSSRTISGNSIRFFDFSGNDPLIENNDADLQTLSLNIGCDGDVSDPLQINPKVGDITITGNISNNGSSILVYGSASKTLTISGGISGAGGITIHENSIVVFSGTANNKTYTGATTLNAGKLIISSNQTLESIVLNSGGTLEIDPGVTLTINGSFTGGGTIINNGKIVVVGSSSFPGASTTISAMNDLEINRAGGVLLDKSLTLTGTLTLTSGTFTVGANTLSLNGPTIAGTTTNIATTSSSSLSFGGSASSVAIPSSVIALNNLTINNANGVSTNSNITISGTLALTSGILNVGANALTLTATTTGSGSFSFDNGATFQSVGGGSYTIPNNIALTSGTINIPTPFGGGGEFVLTGVISGDGAFNQTSDGSGRRITINNANSFTGGYTMSGSGSGYPTATFNNAGAFGSGTITSTITGTDTARGFFEPSVDLSAGLGVTNNLSVAGASDRFVFHVNGSRHLQLSGQISGSGYIVKRGTATLTLTGANSYTGLTYVTGGTLRLNKTGGTTIPATNNVTINGGTLRVSTNQTINNLTLSSGTLTVDAGTTLTINGTYNATGGTINNLGTIVYAGGTVTFPGTGVTVNNGTASTLTNLEIASSGTVTLGTAITVSGGLTLSAGTFTNGSNLTLSNGATITRSGGTLSNTPTFGSSVNVVYAQHGSSITTGNEIPATSTVLNNVTISNTNGVTLGSATSVNGVLAFGNVNNTTLTTGGNLIVKSGPSSTARIADLTNGGVNSGNAISGTVTVERYISASGNRAYRLLTPGVTTSTSIKDNWQEGVNNTAQDFGSNQNPNTTYGTHITGSTDGSNGFDATLNASPSMFTYTPGNPGSWTGISNTNSNTLDAKTGYLLFIRGDRGINLSLTVAGQGSTNTTLRATGTIQSGNQPFTVSGTLNHFSLVTNPYPSPINWASVIGDGDNTGKFGTSYSLWDPNGGTRGSYVTVNTSGIASAGVATNHIQSGQAFFVQNADGVSTTFTIKESHKSTTNNIDVFRTGAQKELLRAGLFFTHTDNTRKQADGVVAVYDNNYSATIDGNDAMQIANWDEDVAIVSNNKELSIESRPLADNGDTIFFNMARLREINYEWEFKAENFNAPGLTAYVQDAFTNTETAISLIGTTVVPFTVTSNAASKAANRFRVVYRTSGVLPVTLTSVKAFQQNNGITVAWNTQSESGMQQYEVEKSANGTSFSKVNTTAAKSGTTNSYNYFDATPINGANYYRIKAISLNGDVKYSAIVVVRLGDKGTTLSVYPNPVKGNTISIALNGLNKGNYTLSVFNQLGQQVLNRVISHNGGVATQTIDLGKLSAGLYELRLSNGETVFTEKLIKE